MPACARRRFLRTVTCAPRVSIDLVSLGTGRALVARGRSATVATSHFYYADVFAEGSNWSVQGQFYVTNRGSQWWINKVDGTPHCNRGNARVTWCGYVNNGTSSFQVGFNDSHGYARFEPALWLYSAKGCWVSDAVLLPRLTAATRSPEPCGNKAG